MNHPDYPLRLVAEGAEQVIREGGDVFQKWTCKHCGSRQTMGIKNIFYRSGKCEACGQTSIITMCNYVAILHRKK